MYRATLGQLASSWQGRVTQIDRLFFTHARIIAGKPARGVQGLSRVGRKQINRSMAYDGEGPSRPQRRDFVST
jgi:hypothetical protein